ncbi:hypothetical protein [Nocardia noduli]|uniref:hypothetical protein n=1 Tax=Nocardia noduli TaxID=2815722 RepID=UPI0020B34AA8|nr:hypothetical protein [Nocardia noduli]
MRVGALWLVIRTVPESPDHAALDDAGQLLGLIPLGGLTYALNIASFALGFGTSAVFVLLALYLRDAQGFRRLPQA